MDLGDLSPRHVGALGDVEILKSYLGPLVWSDPPLGNDGNSCRQRYASLIFVNVFRTRRALHTLRPSSVLEALERSVPLPGS